MPLVFWFPERLEEGIGLLGIELVMVVPLVWALGCELRYSGPVASTMTLKHNSSPQSHIYNICRAGDVMRMQMGLVA